MMMIDMNDDAIAMIDAMIAIAIDHYSRIELIDAIAQYESINEFIDDRIIAMHDRSMIDDDARAFASIESNASMMNAFRFIMNAKCIHIILMRA